MTARGIEDVYTTTGSVNVEKIVEFLFVSVCYHLSCHLMVRIVVRIMRAYTILIKCMRSAQELEQSYALCPHIASTLCLRGSISEVEYFLKANGNVYLCTSSPEDMVKLAFSR